MAQKLLKTKKAKITPKKDAVKETSIVLVGTYKEKQLAWIKKNGVYNYPVKDGDKFDAESFGRIKELWLYASAKGTQHAFAAEFVEKMSREDFLAAYPTYAKLGGSQPSGRGRSPSAPHTHYYVFKTTPLKYGPATDGHLVIARTSDFGGRSAKVKKAIEQFKADGEFAPLAAYLPPDLAKVPRQQLRVCEAAVQLNFFCELGEAAKPDVPFPPVDNPTFTFIDLFAGIGGFRLAMQAYGGRCVFSSEWNEAAQKTYCANYGEITTSRMAA